MTLLAVVMTLPLLLAPIDSMAGIASKASATFALRPVLIYLAGYFLFGAGYIAYMTFMIAYVRDAGGGAPAQSAFWCLIGLSAFVTPWIWGRVLALDAAVSPPRSFSASSPSESRCRSSGIRHGCWRYRRLCSASRFSQWWDQPPLSCASTIRPPPGPRELRQ